MYPLQTVLDDSIGCALWFAARGRGVLYSVQEGKGGQDCLSSAKVCALMDVQLPCIHVHKCIMCSVRSVLRYCVDLKVILVFMELTTPQFSVSLCVCVVLTYCKTL